MRKNIATLALLLALTGTAYADGEMPNGVADGGIMPNGVTAVGEMPNGIASAQQNPATGTATTGITVEVVQSMLQTLLMIF